MYTLIDADAIVAFDDLAGSPQEKNWLDNFYPALMTNSRAGGKTWGIPFQRSTILLYWNKALFKEAGLDPAAGRLEGNVGVRQEADQANVIREKSRNGAYRFPHRDFPTGCSRG